MEAHDIFIFIILVVVMCVYGAVGKRALSTKKPLLRGGYAVAFEFGEIAMLGIFVWYAVCCKEYGFATAFALALAEHIRQVVACERQAFYGARNVITLVEFMVLMVVAGFRGVWWVAATLFVGVLIHVYMLVAKRPFIDVVCVNM